MSIQYYPNGIGGYPPGDFLDTCRPLQMSGNVWYVNSNGGVAGPPTNGLDREKPLLSLSNAIANAFDNDIIVFLPGHTETLTVAQTISKKLTLVGEGVTDGKPSVSFFSNSASESLFNITGNAVQLCNLYFPENKTTGTFAQKRIVATGADLLMRGCYTECGAKDVGTALMLDGLRPRIENSTFISTAVAMNAQPQLAIGATANLSGLTMVDVVVSSGKFGFSSAAVSLNAASSLTLKVEGLSLLLGADMTLPAAATGYVNVQLATGGSRVQWG